MTQVFGWIVALLLGLLGITQWQYHNQKEKAEDAREEADANKQQADVNKAAIDVMEEAGKSQKQIKEDNDEVLFKLKDIDEDPEMTEGEKDAETDKIAAEIVQQTHDRANSRLLDNAK